MSEHLTAERNAILTAALPNVPFDGWTRGCLRKAAVAAGYDEDMARRAFPGGAADAVEFYVAEADRQMLEELERRDLPSMKIRERIATAVRVRLEQAASHREAVRRALAVQAMPRNARPALKSLYRTVDAMWYAAGDNATDFNFYTKRALLAGVYSSTLLFWLNDNSDDFADSWEFLDRRIEEVMSIMTVRRRIEKVTDRFPDLPSPWAVLGRLRHGTRRTA